MENSVGKGLFWSNATDPCHIKEGPQLNQGDTGQIYDHSRRVLKFLSRGSSNKVMD